MAFGLVDRFAVIGSESGLRSVIETTLGGAALAHTSGYSKLLAAAPSDALAHIYSNPASSTQAPKQEGLSGLLGVLGGAHAANISLVPSASSLTLDADTLASGGRRGGGLLSRRSRRRAGARRTAGGIVAGDRPGPRSARRLDQDVQDLQGLVSLPSALGGGAPESTAGISLGGLLQGLIAPLRVLGAPSAQARRDFASWMGSAGIFASGASLLELKAAVVITSKDPALSRAAVTELAAQLRKAGGSVTPVSIAGTDAAVGAQG